jgi:hypothetical protein
MKTKTISIFDKSIYFLVILTITVAFLPRFAIGQVSKTHRITVVVNPVTVMLVTVGTINLDIPNGATAVVIAGQDAMTVTDNTCLLKWGTNSSAKKVTIYTSLSTPIYTLKVLATNLVINGTILSPAPQSVGEVTISPSVQDLLTNIANSSGHCTLQYTGISLASQGIGNDSHTLTLTIAAQ